MKYAQDQFTSIISPKAKPLIVEISPSPANVQVKRPIGLPDDLLDAVAGKRYDRRVMPTVPEPWLRGPIPGVHPFIAPILYAFQQAREDLAVHTAGLATEQVWATPHGFGSLGFHIRHIAGSTDRLMTYLEGKQLTETQIIALQHEHDPGVSLEQLLDEVESSFQNAEAIVRELNPANLSDPRNVGRKHSPTTVIGLLTHIAEHTQRHLGQAIAAAKLARVGNLLPHQP